MNWREIFCCFRDMKISRPTIKTKQNYRNKNQALIPGHVEYFIPFFFPNGSKVDCFMLMRYWHRIVVIEFQNSNISFKLLNIILSELILLILRITFYYNPGTTLAWKTCFLYQPPNLASIILILLRNKIKFRDSK